MHRVLGERAVVDLERRARLRQRLQRHVARAGLASWSTAWRWLNVPRSTSSPVRRMLMPSARIDASASSSAVAQSTVRSSGVVEHCGRASRAPRSSFLWTVKPAGSVEQRLRSARAAARAAPPVCVRAAAPGGGASGCGSTKSCSGFSRRSAACSSPRVLLGQRLGLVGGDHAALDQRRAPRSRAPSGARRSSDTSAAA